MPFSHDMVHSLATVVDLVNTPPGDIEELGALVVRRQVSGIEFVNATDLAEVQALLGRLPRRLHLPPTRTWPRRGLNTLLGRTRITPSLTRHDGFPLHVHYFAPGASLAEHLAADCGVALAHVLVEGERERLRTCSAPDCSHVFVDESRNRSRVYCDSRTCGNRMHVAAYRARRRA